ncbi:cytochrome b/b6 domain-containing protein [Thiocystis violacea]|uniref:cytochrome b/b6 domain-containing protein n=1 Tax=Thiocystis violacea TaxID=13725 RepID=UPI0019064C1A|nr:cytochrome b/b6 domain-containing protein [Thiocystis violacea]MBK1717252.1 cytochrome B [Thiocystis violacea]
MPSPVTTDPANRLDTPLVTPVYVWDPLVRLFHWSLAAGFFTAFLVEDNLLDVHVWAGYLVLALIAVRLVWGVVGTPYARFDDFVRGPRQVGAYLKSMLTGHAPRYLGHNPAGGIMVVVVLLAVTTTGVSGLMLYGAQEFAGPLAGSMSTVSNATAHDLEAVHAFLANLTFVLVIAHLAGVLFSSLAHHENLVGAMLTGFKRRED